MSYAFFAVTVEYRNSDLPTLDIQNVRHMIFLSIPYAFGLRFLACSDVPLSQHPYRVLKPSWRRCDYDHSI